MTFKQWCLILWLPWSVTLQAAEPLKLDWLDLVPSQDRQRFNPKGMLDESVTHLGDQMALQPEAGGIRRELNNSVIKIAGFAVPLETEDKDVKEFLFAPYFGACIHVPPPPANQLIYVQMAKGIPMRQLQDVIYIVGTLKAESFGVDYIEAGYRLEGQRIEKYDGG